MRHSLGTIAWRGLKGRRRRDTAMMLCVLAAVFALLCSGAVLSAERQPRHGGSAAPGSLRCPAACLVTTLTAADADAFVQQTAPAAVGRVAQYAALVNDKDLPLARWALWDGISRL